MYLHQFLERKCGMLGGMLALTTGAPVMVHHPNQGMNAEIRERRLAKLSAIPEASKRDVTFHLKGMPNDNYSRLSTPTHWSIFNNR